MTSLELQHVTKTYGDGATRVIALDDASLRIEPGELVALIGPSGSGKSTLLSIAGALLQPDSGRVLLAGQDITAHSPAELARRLHLPIVQPGALPDRPRPAPPHRPTPRDTAQGGHADQLLADLGLTERARHYPEELSGGQRQRVAIGRALMNDPALILADEPTASLDSTRDRQVVTLLATEIHERNKAGILVTHDERLIGLCDRVIHMTDGKSEPSPALVTASVAEHPGDRSAARG